MFTYLSHKISVPQNVFAVYNKQYYLYDKAAQIYCCVLLNCIGKHDCQGSEVCNVKLNGGRFWNILVFILWDLLESVLNLS